MKSITQFFLLFLYLSFCFTSSTNPTFRPTRVPVFQPVALPPSAFPSSFQPPTNQPFPQFEPPTNAPFFQPVDLSPSAFPSPFQPPTNEPFMQFQPPTNQPFQEFLPPTNEPVLQGVDMRPTATPTVSPTPPIVTFFVNVTLSGIDINTITENDRMALIKAIEDCLERTGSLVELERITQRQSTTAPSTLRRRKMSQAEEQKNNNRKLVADNNSGLSAVILFQIMAFPTDSETPESVYQSLSSTLNTKFSNGVFLAALNDQETAVGSTTFQGTTVLSYSLSDPFETPLPTFAPSKSPTSSTAHSSNGGLSKTAVIVIAVVIPVFAVLLIVGGVFYWKNHGTLSCFEDDGGLVPVAVGAAGTAGLAAGMSKKTKEKTTNDYIQEEKMAREAFRNEKIIDSIQTFHPGSDTVDDEEEQVEKMTMEKKNMEKAGQEGEETKEAPGEEHNNHHAHHHHQGDGDSPTGSNKSADFLYDRFKV
jgi:hypothetical protein